MTKVEVGTRIKLTKEIAHSAERVGAFGTVAKEPPGIGGMYPIWVVMDYDTASDPLLPLAESEYEVVNV